MVKTIAILTFEGNPIAAELFYKIRQKYSPYVIYTPDYSFSIRYAVYRKRGIRWLLYNYLFKFAAKKFGVDHKPPKSWKELKQKYPNAFYSVCNHNQLETKNILKHIKPDLGVLIGTVLIKPEIYSIPANGMINLHQGNIPYYRGAPPAYWEHKNNETKMYVSVHKVNKRFDAGEIYEETEFSIEEHKYFVISKYYANRLSIGMLYNSINDVLNGKSGRIVDVTTKVNTVPHLIDILKEIYHLFRYEQ